MIRKNEELYEVILFTLKGENRKMSDIRQNMISKTGDQYSYKQLQNTIYHMVRTGKVGRSEDGEYFLKKGFETGGVILQNMEKWSKIQGKAEYI